MNQPSSFSQATVAEARCRRLRWTIPGVLALLLLTVRADEARADDTVFLSLSDLLVYYNFEQTGSAGLANQAPGATGFDALPLINNTLGGSFEGGINPSGPGFGGSPNFDKGGSISDRSNLIVGNALNLVNTRNDALRVPVGTADLGPSFTIATWHQLTPSGVADLRPFVFESSFDYDVSWGPTTAGNYTAYINTTVANSVSAGPLAPNQWHHVVHSFSSDGATTTAGIYVNGQFLGSLAAPTASLDFDSLNFGRHRGNAGGDRRWDGLMDEVNLWQRALDAPEVLSVFGLGLAGLGLDDQVDVFVKGNNSQALNQNGSWQGGLAPTTDAVALFNDTFAQAGALTTGGPVAVGGLRVTTGSDPIVIDNPNFGESLEVGAFGIDMLNAQRDLTIANLALGADQAWGIAPGRTLMAGSDSDLSGGHSLFITGGGTAVISSFAELNRLEIGQGELRVGDGGSSGALDVTGNLIVRPGGTLTYDRTGNPTVGTVITGGGTLMQDGPGTLRIGATGNDVNIAVNQGTFEISEGGWTASYFAAAGRQITVNDGGRLLSTGSHALGGLGATFNRPRVTVEEGGVWQLGAEQYFSGGDLTLNGGTILQSGSDFRLQGGVVTVGPSSTGSRFEAANNGRITLFADPTFNVANGPAAVDLEIAAPIRENTPSRMLFKDGPGTMVLSGDNTYSGGTAIDRGRLVVGNGGTTGSLGSGPVALAPNTEIAFNRSDAVVIGNQIDGDGAVAQAGSGALVLTGNNSHSGGTSVSQGTLVIGSAGALGSGDASISGGGTLNVPDNTALSGRTLHMDGGELQVDHSTPVDATISLSGAAAANVIRPGATFDYLVVGGGGGGGARDSAGGGGGGGVLSNLTSSDQLPLLLIPGTYEVTVGDGGAGAVGPDGSGVGRGGQGESSSFDLTTALGGGGGGGYTTAGGNGASGGGGGRQNNPQGGAGIPGQGFAGGRGSNGSSATLDAGGGGGGAGGPGQDAIRGVKGGDGGPGLGVNITGSEQFFGGGGGGTPHRTTVATLPSGTGGIGGGGGGQTVTNLPGINGLDNTGGGGGAARNASANTAISSGGSGGSGIVALRYLGDPVATGGTISAGTGSAAGTTLHTFNQVGQSSFDFNAVLDLTIAGDIHGDGGFSWIDQGTLTLNGNNSYRGGTVIGSGRVQVGDGGSAGSIGTGPVSNNGELVFNRSGVLNVPGNISGPGSVHQTGPGTTRLSGANTHTGGTHINGGTVVAANSGALGSGPVHLSGGTLKGDRSAPLTNDIILSGPAADNSFGGAIAIDYLVVGGGGGGGARDSAGGGGGGGVVSNLAGGPDGQVLLTGGSHSVTVGDGGAGAVGPDGGGGARGGQGESSSFDLITALGGGGGGGYQTAGGNGASGGGGGRQSNPQGGAGIAGQGFAGGSGSNGASANLDAGGGGGGAGGPGQDAIRGVKGGDGGPGLGVNITGTEQFFGGGGGGTPHRFTVGSLPSGAGGIGGGGGGQTVTNLPGIDGLDNTGGGGGAARNASANTAISSGGSGGSGIVALRYLGDPVAIGGSISQGTGAAAGYTIHTFTDAGISSFEIDAPLDLTIAGDISGSGGFRWNEGGTLTLTGANTYSGQTLIQDGTVRVGDGGDSGSLGSGDVVNDGTLVFHRSDDHSVANDISGSGGVDHRGTGTTSLTGSSSYSGPTTVEQGTLDIVGSLGNGAVTVLGDGRLIGTGSIGGNVSVQGGTLAPGYSQLMGIGTMAIAGDLQFASTWELNIDGASAGQLNLDGDFFGSLSDITLAAGDLFNPTLGVPYQIFSGYGLAPVDLFENFAPGGSSSLGAATGMGDINGIMFAAYVGSVLDGQGNLVDGNGIVLLAVPEPGRVVLLVLAGVGLLLRRRR